MVSKARNTVFPHIIAAATTFFLNSSSEETIQGEETNQGGNYMRKYGILFWNLECGNYSREETIQGRKLLICCFFVSIQNLNTCRIYVQF